MSNKKLTTEQVITMRNESLTTIKQLMYKYGVCKSTVYRCLVGTKVIVRKKRLSEETKELIRKEPKDTLKILAYKYNVSISTICKIRMYGGVCK